MKAVYLAETENPTEKINHIQNKFAEIYKLEEQIQSLSFRGNLSLDEILFNHIKVVDDGTKLPPKDDRDEDVFNQPRMNNNREESILKYLDKKIKNNEQIIEYARKLVDKFATTVTFLSEELPKLDSQNSLIGDVAIFEKSLSYRLFILIRHKFEEEKAYTLFFESKELLKMWEALLFTRDFHSKYYNLKGFRDRFELIFLKISQKEKVDDIKTILEKYLKEGFRPDKMDSRNLPKTVLKFVSDSKNTILNNAYGWWQFRKMTYVLYKFEKEVGKDTNVNELRKIMKNGQSVEHILPQEWKWEYIGENDNKPSEKGKAFKEEIKKSINGIGNLLLITSRENSKENNTHPKKKKYNSCSGGSYDEHNNNSNKWENHENWKSIIEERGIKIYDFMIDYFSIKE